MIKKEFNAIYKSISSVSLHQFPADTLRNMYEKYSSEQKKLLDAVKSIEKTRRRNWIHTMASKWKI